LGCSFAVVEAKDVVLRVVVGLGSDVLALVVFCLAYERFKRLWVLLVTSEPNFLFVGVRGTRVGWKHVACPLR